MSGNKKHIDISIIIATYNRAHLITESLATIQNQTYRNWECLIIDDGSSDGTAVVVDEFINEDSRFSYHKRKEKYKKGLPGCRNQGLDLAQGAHVIFFDDDDIVHPENLQYCIDLKKEKHCSFIRYDKKPFKDSKEIKFKSIKDSHVTQFGIGDLNDMVTGKIPFASCCVMWDRRCFAKERFNEDLMYAEEWECYSRILSQGFKGITTDAVLYFNRKHANSNTGHFQNKDPEKIKSKIKASELIIENLASKNLFSSALKNYFIRLGFQLNSKRIIEKALRYSEAGLLERMKYKFGYFAYPVLRPLFILKGKLLIH
ncbi:glycosyltransferase family 2 protein [Salegentibacter flavus]|uniref:Glycosyltransferase involved in cell wall bisynthesis n=1 Tax=Salegentibacter flavus TaxID=287099 RepID=A0A1I4Y6N9_9FLAO|nr:glycosyltransferase family 2 protein [Salegentibacter flavus]SFN33180.1 Glycosyltransferase involved in cell wall bisynthesis [Salegentibacter flavus]